MGNQNSAPEHKKSAAGSPPARLKHRRYKSTSKPRVTSTRGIERTVAGNFDLYRIFLSRIHNWPVLSVALHLTFYNCLS